MNYSNALKKNNIKGSGIEIFNLTKFFGKKLAVDNINIEFKKNNITGLIGFNGSGKTTTYNALVNFISKNNGKIFFEGEKSNINIRRQISYLAAGTETKNPMKVINHLTIIANLNNMNKKEIQNTIFKYSKILEFEEFLKMPIKSLSKGNQQKLKLIAVFLNPNLKYLFLDEPFDGLDPIMVEKIKNHIIKLKNNGVTIALTSHKMDVIQTMCDEFYIMLNGKVVDSRKTDDKTIEIKVNKEVDISPIKNLKEVVSIKINKNDFSIFLKSIDYFKKINKVLIKDKNYIYSSLHEKNIAESAFEKYGIVQD